MRILIVDDSHEIVELMVKVLTTVGHEVVSSYSGREGLEMIQGDSFDLIFLDIAMPDFSGLDVIDALVQSGKITQSPVVLFTASSITDAEVAELVRRGVHSCLRKPVRMEALFEKIEEVSRSSNAAAKKSV
jgi:CheY-like chemotaxis protein